MNPADEEAAKLVPIDQLAGTVAGSRDDLEEQLHATLKDLQRTSHQSKPAKDLHGSNDKLDEKLRVSVEALLHPSPPSIPAEEVEGDKTGVMEIHEAVMNSLRKNPDQLKIDLGKPAVPGILK